MKELLALLNDAGHTDFRDARGPMGFTQRQAAGKFTRDEAAAFIARLQGNELEGAPRAVVPGRGSPRKASYCATYLPTSSLPSSAAVVGPWPSPWRTA